MQMGKAIRTVIRTQLETALATYFPAGKAAAYFGFREDGAADPMAGQWFAVVHASQSRQDGESGANLWSGEVWTVNVTIMVRTSVAPADRQDTPQDLLEELNRVATSKLRDDPWGIMAAINTQFANSNTNGLITPFLVQEPQPIKGKQIPPWLKAVMGKGVADNILASTIRLTGAKQLQLTGSGTLA